HLCCSLHGNTIAREREGKGKSGTYLETLHSEHCSLGGCF
ncbi:hypothetical protein Nmel_006457, partial [Mimus melanotis]